jgi:predicted transcriptional regulator
MRGVGQRNIPPFMSLTNLIERIEQAVLDKLPPAQIRPLLGTLREQAEAIENHVRTLESDAKNDVLGKENDRLRANLDDTFDEIERLKVKLRDHEEKSSSTGNPEDNEIKILSLLARQEGMTDAQIAKQFAMNVQRVRYHLNRLDDQKLVYAQRYVNRDSDWNLSIIGRAYVVENGLIE